MDRVRIQVKEKEKSLECVFLESSLSDPLEMVNLEGDLSLIDDLVKKYVLRVYSEETISEIRISAYPSEGDIILDVAPETQLDVQSKSTLFEFEDFYFPSLIIKGEKLKKIWEEQD